MTKYTYYSSQSYRTLNHWQSGEQTEALDSLSTSDFITNNFAFNMAERDNVCYFFLPVWKPKQDVVQTKIRVPVTQEGFSASVFQTAPMGDMTLDNRVFESKNTNDNGTFYTVVYDQGSFEYDFEPLRIVEGAQTNIAYKAPEKPLESAYDRMEYATISRDGYHERLSTNGYRSSTVFSSYTATWNKDAEAHLLKPTLHRYFIVTGYFKTGYLGGIYGFLDTDKTAENYTFWDPTQYSFDDDNYITSLRACANNSMSRGYFAGASDGGVIPDWVSKTIKISSGAALLNATTGISDLSYATNQYRPLPMFDYTFTTPDPLSETLSATEVQQLKDLNGTFSWGNSDYWSSSMAMMYYPLISTRNIAQLNYIYSWMGIHNNIYAHNIFSVYNTQCNIDSFTNAGNYPDLYLPNFQYEISLDSDNKLISGVFGRYYYTIEKLQCVAQKGLLIAPEV